MLSFLRRGVKSIFAKILIALLIASFAVWGIGDVFNFRADTTLASVGDTDVSAQQFADAMRRQRQNLSQRQGTLISFQQLREAGIDRQIFGTLLRNAAFKEESANMGLGVSDAAVAQAIRAIPAFHDDQGAFSDFTYRSVLAQQGFTPPEFEAIMRDNLHEQMVAGSISQMAAPLPGLAKHIAQRQGERRSIATLHLDPAMAPDPGKPDQAALETYYQDHKDAFTEPERRWARYLSIDMASLIKNTEISEKDARAYYEAHSENFTVAPGRTVEQIAFDTLEQAQEAAKRLQAGEITFKDLAKERGLEPDDIGLGRIEMDDLPKSSADAVFAAEAPGLVGPVETAFGAALLNVTNIDPGGTAPFEDVREAISLSLARDQAQIRAPELANEIDDMRAEGTSLEDIAAKTGLALEKIDGLARDGSLADKSQAEGLAADPVFQDELFNAIQGDERDMIERKDGGYFLVMLDRVEDSHIPALAEITETVSTAWQHQKRLEALDAMAKDISAQIKDGKSLADIAAQMNHPLETLPPFTRGDAPPVLDPKQVEQIFAQEKGGISAMRTTDGSGVMISELQSIIPLDADTLEKQTARLETGLDQAIRADTEVYFTRALEARLGIAVHQDAYDTVLEQLDQSHGG